MKTTVKSLRIAVLAAMLVFAFAGCKEPEESPPPLPPPPSVINIAAIEGIDVPTKDECPVTVIIENTQYSGTVEWSPYVNYVFANSIVYTATITLTAKSGYTLQGVAADFFTVEGATSVSNDANSGVITAIFPSTDAHVINIAAIQGVTVPVNGGVPVKNITENEQYRGDVTWNGNPVTFASGTRYTATITLTPKDGFTLHGVSAWFFTVAGAIWVVNDANSGVITATFPATASDVINIAAIQGVTVPENGGVPSKNITENEQFSGKITWNDNPYTFAASTQYTATITLTAKTGFTLQGVAADFFTVAGATSVSNVANSGVITAVFPATAPTSTSSVSISITAPVKGATPSATASGFGNFTFGSVSWSPNNNPFLGGTEYTASVTLTSNSGYTFTGLSSATINGQGATVSNNTGSAVTLSYKFAKTDEKAVSSIAIKTQPTKLTYTHGDTLDLTGLVVTLTHDDTTSEDVTAANFIDKNITANPATGNSLIYSTHNGKPVKITYGSLTCNSNNLTVNKATPTAADFNISGTGTFTYDGNTKVVTVTPKEGKSNGSITVKYNNITTEPLAVGTYTVTFDVAAAENFNAGIISAGTLTIEKATPIASDFAISGIGSFYYDGSSKTVSVTPQAGKSNGTITVKYNNSTTAPSAVGNYTVTFDVTATTNYNAASGFSAGTLIIERATPVATDFDISGIGSFTYDDNPRTVTIKPKAGKTTGIITIKYNGDTKPPSEIGTYIVTFDVAAVSPNFNAASELSAGTIKINPFTTVVELNAYLQSKPVNTATTPYNIKMNTSSLSNIANTLNNNNNKYIYLDLSDSTITTIDRAFYNQNQRIGCATLVGITIPNSVTSIGFEAFRYCTNLASVTIPDSVTSIGDSAFVLCTSLTSITIPESVTAIGYSAFNNCTNLASVTIPNSVTSINSWAFEGCTSLTSITIPNSVIRIWDSTFENCMYLNSVTIGSGVTSIESRAFYGCTRLTSVTIPNSVKGIGNYAFYACTSLTSITIPNSVIRIWDSTFEECRYLNSVTIGSGVTGIDSRAFYNCVRLTSVTIPNSVTAIGKDAFSGCTGLTSVTFQGAVDIFHYSAFGSVDGIEYIGDLSDKYLAGGIGTYTRPNTSSLTWTKQ